MSPVLIVLITVIVILGFGAIWTGLMNSKNTPGIIKFLLFLIMLPLLIFGAKETIKYFKK